MEYKSNPPKHYEIGDILVVKVLSFDDETTNFFNVENNVNFLSSITFNIYLNGFTINQDGIIEIPHREVYVLNQTLDEAKESIEKVDEYLKEQQ